MKVLTNNNIHQVIDENSKTVSLTFMYKVKKTSASDVFYANIASELLKKRTSIIDQTQFDLLKLESYNVIYDISVRDFSGFLVFEYGMNFINPKYLPDIDVQVLVKCFEQFVENRKYDEKQIDKCLDLELLIYNDLEQSYRELASRITEDKLFNLDSSYMTLDIQKNCIDNFSKVALDTFISNLNIIDPIVLYKGPKDVIDLCKYASGTSSSLKMNNYQTQKADDFILEKEIDQAIVTMVYTLDNTYSKIQRQVASTIFGSGSSSFLFKIVREQKQMCYYVYSEFLNKKTMQVVIGTNSDKIDSAIESIVQIISKFDELYDDTHLNVAKKQLIDHYTKKANDPNFNYQLVRNHAIIDTQYDIEEIINEINQVDSKTVKNIINELISNNKIIIK